MAAETVNSQNFSQQEVQAQNEKFARYNGTNKRGSEVKSDGFVTVTGETTASILLDPSATAITKRADTSKMYDIIVNYDSKSGLVNTITVKLHTSTNTNP